MEISSNKPSVSNTESKEKHPVDLGKKGIKNQNPIPNKNSKKSDSSIEHQQKAKNMKLNNIRRADSHGSSMTLRRSYGMVVSGFENVAKQQQLSSEAADQFGKTVSVRIKELNDESIRTIKELPEYKSFGLENINELGDEISDIIQDPKEYLKGFALLKNPKFAKLMESTESVHRSFAESMKDNGEEKLLFGMLEMIKDLGGLVGFQESTQINQNNSSVNIKA